MKVLDKAHKYGDLVTKVVSTANPAPAQANNTQSLQSPDGGCEAAARRWAPVLRGPHPLPQVKLRKEADFPQQDVRTHFLLL